jgi:hypothetical protein
MTKFPDWNYWMYRYLDSEAGTYRPIHDFDVITDNDIRYEGYDLDDNKWCRKNFWTAQEAALISFHRDPDKIRELYKFDETDDNFLSEFDTTDEEHYELTGFITDIYGLIKSSQEEKTLPPKLLRPDLYVEWAMLVGIDIPHSVLEELNAVQRERREEADPPEPSDETASVGAEPVPKTKKPSQRLENNSTKIILALLLHSGLINKDVRWLSGRLSEIIHEKMGEVEPKAGTIETRLNEAHELVR